MIKAILLDIDGVVIKRHSYFSVRYAEEHQMDPALLVAFFKEKYALCATGKADLKEELRAVVSQWGWQGSVDELLTSWFEAERDCDEVVLAQVKTWREQGIACYLATDQEKYRAEYLLDVVGLNQGFDGAFFSYQLGFQKDNPEFFRAVILSLGLEPGEIEYFDDDPHNVEIAQTLGIKGHFCEGGADLLKRL